MALSIATVWEVRPGVGSDTAGGGFVAGASGTDYSQQNAPQYTATDLTVDASNDLLVSSASHAFAAADVGNLMHVSGSGWTTGFYQIVSAASGAATLDRSPAATSTTGGSYAVGGALFTISAAYAASVAGNTIYVKATGTYTATATLSLSTESSTQLAFIGYTTTRGDGGQVTWTTSTSSISLVTMAGTPALNYLFQNFIFTNTAATRATCFDGGLTGQSFYLRISNCTFSGFTVGLALGYVGGVHYPLSYLFMDACEVTGCSSHGVNCSGPAFLIDCYIHANGGDGVHGSVLASGTLTTGPIHVERSVIYNNTGIGLYNEQGSTSSATWLQLVNCAVVANGSDGIQIAGGSGVPNMQALVVINTIIESNGGYGIHNDSTNAIYVPLLLNNAFRANTSGNYAGAIPAQPSDILLTAEPFTSPSTGDFTLNSTVGGGAACKGAGFPSLIP